MIISLNSTGVCTLIDIYSNNVSALVTQWWLAQSLVLSIAHNQYWVDLASLNFNWVQASVALSERCIRQVFLFVCLFCRLNWRRGYISKFSKENFTLWGEIVFMPLNSEEFNLSLNVLGSLTRENVFKLLNIPPALKTLTVNLHKLYTNLESVHLYVTSVIPTENSSPDEWLFHTL